MAMIASRIQLVTLAALSLCVATGCWSALAAPAQKSSPSVKTKTVAPQEDEAGIKAKLQALSKAVASADAKAAAALWTPDGLYVDEDGVQTTGREAVEQRFAEAFSDAGKRAVDISPESIRFLANNVAVSEGTVNRKIEGVSGLPAARYTMVFVKQDGNWLISRATETTLVAQSSYDHLRELGWLIGDWSAEKNGATVRMKAEWAPSKNFIQCRFETRRPGEPEQIDSQVIGWDPTADQVVSWNFNANGGFSHGNWTRQGRQWLVNISTVQQDGSTAKGVNVISMSDPNTFSWQTLKSEVDGMPVGDTEPLKVQRVVR